MVEKKKQSSQRGETFFGSKICEFSPPFCQPATQKKVFTFYKTTSALKVEIFCWDVIKTIKTDENTKEKGRKGQEEKNTKWLKTQNNNNTKNENEHHKIWGRREISTLLNRWKEENFSTELNNYNFLKIIIKNLMPHNLLPSLPHLLSHNQPTSQH